MSNYQFINIKLYEAMLFYNLLINTDTSWMLKRKPIEVGGGVWYIEYWVPFPSWRLHLHFIVDTQLSMGFGVFSQKLLRVQFQWAPKHFFYSGVHATHKSCIIEYKINYFAFYDVEPRLQFIKCLLFVWGASTFCQSSRAVSDFAKH